jgi:mono/diheme cytochrome c family protein
MNAPRKIPILVLVLVGAIGIFTTLVLAGRITWFADEPPMEYLPNMDHQFKAIPQSGNSYFADRKSLRDPVEGTVARGVEVYLLGQGDIDSAEVHNVDPKLEQSTFLLSRGQNRFNVFCAACHNYDAKSNSKLVQRGSWIGIPNLTREQTRALSNARIFHIISSGQNLMPSYADKIQPIDRWAVIYYLRTLQARAVESQ